MLQFIRSKITSIFIKVLFCVLILSFAVWGIGDIFMGSPTGRAAISVGKTTYNSTEVLEQFDRARRAMRLPPQYSELLRPQILNSVINSLTETGLYEAESRKLGMAAGDELLKDWVGSAPAFRDQLGRYNPDIFRQALSRAGLSEAAFFKTLRSDIKRDQINAAVSGEASLPDTLAETLFNYRAERRVANVVRISLDSIINFPEPSAAELRAHYGASKANYMAPEYRSATYVSLTPEDLAKEVLIPEDDLRAEYGSRQGEFITPETRDLQQFLFADEAAANAANAALTGPLDLAGIAKSLTDAAGTDSSIPLGHVAAADLSNEAERKAAFETAPGKISSPVETPFGWKVFLVKSAVEQSVRDFNEVKEVIRLELAREKALDALFDLSNAFEDALAGGSTIAEAAREIDLPVSRVESVDAGGRGKDGGLVEGLPPSPRFLATVFSTKKRAQSGLVETENNGYFLLETDAVIESRQRILSEVEAAVRQSWTDEKRLAISNTLAQALAEKSKGGIGLTAAAAEMGYSLARVGPFNRSGGGLDTSVYPADMAPIVFEITKADVDLVESETGTVVVELVEIIAADRRQQKTAWSGVIKKLNAAARQDYEDTYLSSLRSQHNVSIDRSYIDRLMAESQ
jgi:peptidyl-prolyl cis-trans isomerase D